MRDMTRAAFRAALESYESQYFCTGQCAQGFAVMILRTPTYAGLGSKAWADAVERQRAKAAAG